MKRPFVTALASLIALLFPGLLHGQGTGFQFPTQNYLNSITQDFNVPNPSYGNKLHTGQDILASSTGMPVVAAGGGTVMLARPWKSCPNWGYILVIEHTLVDGSKVSSIYGHLNPSSVAVAEGQVVSQGTFLGRTGVYSCWAEHVHFGIHLGAYGVSVGIYPSWLNGYLSQGTFPDNYTRPSDFIQAHRSGSVTYTFTGVPFNQFVNTSCPPTCRITGSITLAQPLPPNTNLPVGQLAGSTSNFTPLSFSFTDGVTTATNQTCPDTIFNANTDANGNITQYAMSVCFSQGSKYFFLFYYPPFSTQEGINNGSAYQAYFLANSGVSGGTWSMSSGSPQFLSFTEGNPGLPGDGILVNTPDAGSFTAFHLSQPISLAPVTDGFTLTFFPASNGQPVMSAAIYVASTQNGCNVAEQVFSPQKVTFNGVIGYAVNFTQANLLALGCNLSNLNVTAIVATSTPISNPAQFIITLDAAAFGLGQNAFPGTQIQ